MRALRLAPVLLVALALTGCQPPPPYDPAFVLNQPIPQGQPTDPDSAAAVQRLVTNLHGGRRVLANVSGEVPAVNRVDASAPLRQVDIASVHTQFRLPDDLKVGSGSDHPTEILDASTSRELRVWQADWNASTHTLTGSNASLSYYNNDGAILNPNGTPSTSHPYVGSGAGSGMTYLAGLLSPYYDLDGIDHSIRIAYHAGSILSSFRPPATKSDANGSGSGAVQMGTIFQLLPTVDCASRTAPVPASDPTWLNKTRFVVWVCIALQTHGMVVSDNTGSFQGITVYMEDDATAHWTNADVLGPPNPAGKDCGGNYGFLLRSYEGDPEVTDCASPRRPTDGIPWSQMRVVRAPVSATAW